MALLSQQVAELVVEVRAAEGDDLLRALEVAFQLALQSVGRIRLLPDQVQLGDRLCDLVRQRGVLLGETHHRWRLTLGVQALHLGRVLCLFCLRLPFRGDQLLQQCDALTDRGSVRGRLVPLRLQQFDPRRLAQELLVQHLDLGAQRVGAGLQRPAPRLDLRGGCVCGRRQLLLRPVIRLFAVGLLQTLANRRGSGRLRVETRREVSALRIGGGEVRLLPLQPRFQLLKRRRVIKRRGLLGLREGRRGQGIADLLGLARRRLQGLAEGLRRRPVRGGLVEIA